MKKLLLVFALAFVVAAVSVAPASAAYPTKPVEMTITFKAGGAADISGRTVAKAAEKVFGQPIVAVNRPGGGRHDRLRLRQDRTERRIQDRLAFGLDPDRNDHGKIAL